MNEAEELKILLARAEVLVTEAVEVLRGANGMKQVADMIAEAKEEIDRAKEFVVRSYLIMGIGVIGIVIGCVVGWLMR